MFLVPAPSDAKVHEKMYHYEVQPSDQVWQAIQERLMQEEEERRAVPFWWRSLRMVGCPPPHLLEVGIGASSSFNLKKGLKVWLYYTNVKCPLPYVQAYCLRKIPCDMPVGQVV
jgi:hypothetical protein